MFDKARQEMEAYYRIMDHPSDNPVVLRVHQAIFMHMDALCEANPDMPAVLVKASLHEAISERFEPVIFPESPFFYEMGLRRSFNWGAPDTYIYRNNDSGQPSEYMMARRDRIREQPLWKDAFAYSLDGLGVTNVNSSFDADHHCIGYTDALRRGIGGVIRELEGLLAACAPDDPKRAFREAALRSLRALIRAAHKFSARAGEMLQTETDPKRRENLQFIEETALRVPEYPPETFAEGLAALWFLREATASFEGIGISVIGHVDRLLGGLYDADLRAGRIDEARARELLGLYMLPTDIKFNARNAQWPETSTCMELGGCDENGDAVYNEVTRLAIEAHEELKLICPKLNCRYSGASPDAYLRLMSESLLRGHNNFVMINDDVVIPGQVSAGKKLGDARLYVNGGCQEIMLEGVEHSAGAYFYYSMPRLFDLWLLGGADTAGMSENSLRAMPDPFREAADFESFYAQFLAALRHNMGTILSFLRPLGETWRDIHPCPMFSATIMDCIENGKDYTAGGARYNPGTICACGLATLVDSLTAIRIAVYEERMISMSALLNALRGDWKDCELLRLRMSKYPKFGHGDARADALAARFVSDMIDFGNRTVNERGGHFQFSMFVYNAFSFFARYVRATPDGRKKGDLLSQGVAPSRMSPVRSITDAIASLQSVDFRSVSGASVLDAQLPLTSGLKTEHLVGLLRAFCAEGGPTLQPNVVSVADLIDAKQNPDRHRDLVVRICGLSAYFVNLTKDVQDEIIARNLYAV